MFPIGQSWLARGAHGTAKQPYQTPDVTVVTELPHEHKTDHPEGLELWPEAGPTGMLVLYDSPAKMRVGPRDFSLTADIFTLSEA